MCYQNRGACTYIHDRENVEIVLVNKAFDLGARGIVGEQIVREILSNHRADPLPGVHRPVNDNGWLAALPRGTIEMNSGDWPALKRVTDLHNLRVRRMGCLEVVQELQVVGIGVVRVEPRRVCAAG